MVYSVLFGTTSGNAQKEVLVDDSGRLVLSVLDTVIIEEETDSFTLDLTQNGKQIDVNKATAVNVTVPAFADVAFPNGSIILFRQKGAGGMTFVPDTGVTIDSAGGALSTDIQYTSALITKISTNTWWLRGDLIQENNNATFKI